MKEKVVQPFKTGKNANEEELELQKFDLVALYFYMNLPAFESSDATSEELLMKLIQHRVENSPSELNKIMNEVIELPKSRGKEFSELISRTKLAHKMNTARVVTDRLEFICGLEKILFDTDLGIICVIGTQAA